MGLRTRHGQPAVSWWHAWSGPRTGCLPRRLPPIPATATRTVAATGEPVTLLYTNNPPIKLLRHPGQVFQCNSEPTPSKDISWDMAPISGSALPLQCSVGYQRGTGHEVVHWLAHLLVRPASTPHMGGGHATDGQPGRAGCHKPAMFRSRPLLLGKSNKHGAMCASKEASVCRYSLP